VSCTSRTSTYRRPTWVRRALVNPVARFVVLRGLTGGADQNLMRVLRVAGRRTGRPYDVPIRVAVKDGQHYVVSLSGETEWARNLRAASTATVLDGPRAENVRSEELTAPESEAFLRWYVTVPEHGLSVRAGLRINPRRPDPEGLWRAAQQHPVFRLVPIAG
jgi:deazaflavin-dependent oxidoreductase (nitroreductase family)